MTKYLRYGDNYTEYFGVVNSFLRTQNTSNNFVSPVCYKCRHREVCRLIPHREQITYEVILSI